jgi:hypothetical protein
MDRLGVWQFGTRGLHATAGAPSVALTRTLASSGELEVGFVGEEGALLGAWQSASDGPEGAIARGTPGCAVRVGPGTLHVVLALGRLDCPESKILNRNVRPLLAAITKATSVPARYFDRDWVDVKSHPVAHVGFAHERATGRTVVEAFVAVRTPFSCGPRGSYLGKAPATLEEVAGKVDDAKLVAAVVGAYGGGGVGVGGGGGGGVGGGGGGGVGRWAARVDEAIGPVCAGRDASGRMRVGGEWMASFDAVRELEDRIARGEPVRSAVDSVFTAPHTALFGVRSLESFARALDLAFAV